MTLTSRRRWAALAATPLLSFLLWSVSTTDEDDRDRTADRAAIRAHIDSIFQAYVDRDLDRIRATHSDDWRGFKRTSTSVLRGNDAYMEQTVRALQSGGGMTGYEMLEFDVSFHGDSAVVCYIAALDLRDNPFSPRIRVLDVYRKDEHWIQVASNTCTHPDTEAAFHQELSPVPPARRDALLDTREAVWRAWYSHDTGTLDRILPPEAIAFGPRGELADRAGIMAGSRAFAESDAKLLRLEFSETRIQLYGSLALLYYGYEIDVQTDERVETRSGRASAAYVQRQGTWLNTSWHMDERD